MSRTPGNRSSKTPKLPELWKKVAVGALDDPLSCPSWSDEEDLSGSPEENQQQIDKPSDELIDIVSDKKPPFTTSEFACPASPEGVWNPSYKTQACASAVEVERNGWERFLGPGSGKYGTSFTNSDTSYEQRERDYERELMEWKNSHNAAGRSENTGRRYPISQDTSQPPLVERVKAGPVLHARNQCKQSINSSETELYAEEIIKVTPEESNEYRNSINKIRGLRRRQLKWKREAQKINKLIKNNIKKLDDNKLTPQEERQVKKSPILTAMQEMNRMLANELRNGIPEAEPGVDDDDQSHSIYLESRDEDN